MRVWTTHKEYLLVFVNVQNVVKIDAVICINYDSFNVLRVRLENVHLFPKLGVWETSPQYGEQYQSDT